MTPHEVYKTTQEEAKAWPRAENEEKDKKRANQLKTWCASGRKKSDRMYGENRAGKVVHGGEKERNNAVGR